jgi:hypothetical protein
MFSGNLEVAQAQKGGYVKYVLNISAYLRFLRPGRLLDDEGCKWARVAVFSGQRSLVIGLFSHRDTLFTVTIGIKKT